MSDEHEDDGGRRPSGADVKTWILGGLWAISMALGGFIGSGFAARLDRLEAQAGVASVHLAALEVRASSSASDVSTLGPKIDDMNQRLASLTAQVQGLRADLDRDDRRDERRSAGR